eukprot:gnl/TRDRNA2_/TRDRNA2_79644_c0_seq2.p1 gnl/TRDRNA2_/TRDRNA2_79644_c0~~gnl/TRDRNA2_/TRDRNA2_79644_c0_seq2.p1  ORF type:complete len:554 (+),score=86.51 gnl/TRDRNA2_/TRDRNA2_79644_c0_seq2:65-1663(+)
MDGDGAEPLPSRAAAVLWVLAGVAVVWLAKLITGRIRLLKHARAIPGPPASFLWGNMDVLRHRKWRRRRDLVWCELFKKYGPVVRIVLPIFWPEELLVGFGSQETCQEVVNHPDCQSRRAPPLDTMVSHCLIVMPEDGIWRAHRKALAPAFAKRMLQFFEPMIVEESQAFVAALREKRAAMGGGPVDMHELLFAGTYDIIGRVGFGASFGSKNNPNDPALHNGNKIMENVYAATLNPLERLWYGTYGWVCRWLHRVAPSISPELHEIDQLASHFEELFSPIISRLRAAGDSEKERQSTMVGRMVSFTDEAGRGLSDKELLGELAGVLVAGHETTATTLSWAVMLLARHPEAQLQAAAEADAAAAAAAKAAAEGDSRLAGAAAYPFLKQVFYEALRLYPTVAILPRAPSRDAVVAGYFIPKYARLFPCSPAYAPGDRVFDPWRAPCGGIQAGQRFHPFGGGRRHCLGWQLAELVSTTLLAAILREFRMSDAGMPLVPSLDMTLGPKESGAWVVLTPRHESPSQIGPVPSLLTD